MSPLRVGRDPDDVASEQIDSDAYFADLKHDRALRVSREGDGALEEHVWTWLPRSLSLGWLVGITKILAIRTTRRYLQVRQHRLEEGIERLSRSRAALAP